MQATSIRLFISHASADQDVAFEVIQLIRAALNLPSGTIRCTSVDGYRLPGGADTDSELKREVHEAEAFIGIVSPASVQSVRMPSPRATTIEIPAESPTPPPRRLNAEERDFLADLPTEARELLAEAVQDRRGEIFVAESMQGVVISTNGREFSTAGDRRSEARARAAVRQLRERQIVESEGDGSILTLTDHGYRLGDLLSRLRMPPVK